MKQILTEEETQRVGKRNTNQWPIATKVLLWAVGIMAGVIVYQNTRINTLQDENKQTIKIYADALAAYREAERIRDVNSKMRTDSIIFNCEKEKQEIWKDRVKVVENDNRKLYKALK